ncbi:MAG: Mfa1 family fimbria major subunit [Tannerellaceae bacterium]|nr:Mfa1 family fimbria major subunit [Tannerellaceae bacterium]
MKQTFKFFVAIAAMAAGMTACSSEEIVPDVQSTIEHANLTIVINNNEPATRAVVDANAVDSETEIKTITLFVFGQGTKVEADTTFKAGEGTNPFKEVSGQENKFTATFLQAPIGAKNVYVGVNLPNDLKNFIKENGVAAVYELDELGKLADLYPISTSNGFPMFSDGEQTPSLTIKQGQPNKLEVSVKRFVAKVTLQTSAAFEANANGERTADGVTVDKDLTFAMGQINTKFFPYPKKVGGKYQDPNYSAIVSGNAITYQADFINDWSHDFKNDLTWPGTAFDNFKAVAKDDDVKNGDMTKYVPRYVLENTNEKRLEGELTYATVEAKFTPKYTHSYSGSTVKATENTTNKNDYAFLYVFNDGGTFYYFTDKTEADQYKADTGNGYLTYVNCICFYDVYLNPNEKNNVYRNDYYKITIEKISRLGDPYPGTDHPTFEKDGKADLEVTITVQKWNLVAQPTILGNE